MTISQTLSLGIGPSAGQIVTLDLETVGFNLEGIALEDVLEFRAQHLTSTAAWSVRRAIAELGAVVDGGERARLLEDRRDELLEQAEALRLTARSRWRMPLARFSLGAAGATANGPWKVRPGVDARFGLALLERAPGPAPTWFTCNSVHSRAVIATLTLRRHWLVEWTSWHAFAAVWCRHSRRRCASEQAGEVPIHRGAWT